MLLYITENKQTRTTKAYPEKKQNQKQNQTKTKKQVPPFTHAFVTYQHIKICAGLRAPSVPQEPVPHQLIILTILVICPPTFSISSYPLSLSLTLSVCPPAGLSVHPPTHPRFHSSAFLVDTDLMCVLALWFP